MGLWRLRQCALLCQYRDNTPTWLELRAYTSAPIYLLLWRGSVTVLELAAAFTIWVIVDQSQMGGLLLKYLSLAHSGFRSLSIIRGLHSQVWSIICIKARC